MVGDRGMITTARIKDLRELEGMAWITCLRHPAIKKLMADDGPLQLSLFDEQDLAEISSGDFPGERLIACRNPFEAAKRARTREELLPGDRGRPGHDRRPGRRRAGQGPGQDRRPGREGHQQAEGRQALHPGHRRRPDLLAPRPGQHRRRGRHRRDLRHPHPRSRGNPRRRRRRGRLQGPRAPGTGLPAPQGRGPGPAAHLAPARGPGPRPRADLHARLLPHLAPAPGLGAADLHRRAPPGPRQPRRPGPPLPIGQPPRPPSRPDPANSPSAASAT